MPPGSNSASARSPRTRCIEARRFEPASVSSNVPLEKSNAARPTLPGTFVPGSFQRNRPAIIKWMTRNASSSSSQTTRLPSRRMPVTSLPSAACMGGSTERTRNGLARRMRCRRRPTIRGRSACRYSSMSGSSGTYQALTSACHADTRGPSSTSRRMARLATSDRALHVPVRK